MSTTTLAWAENKVGGAELISAVRKVSMSAVLYYRFNEPVLPDSEYDRLCKLIGEHWEVLPEFEQWRLGGDKEAFLATGFHIRITRLCLHAALQWAGLPVHEVRDYMPQDQEWQTDEQGVPFFIAGA